MKTNREGAAHQRTLFIGVPEDEYTPAEIIDQEEISVEEILAGK